MSSNDNQRRTPSQGQHTARPTVPVPKIRINVAEANSLGFRSVPSTADPILTPAFPTTPTPTLGGPAVRQARGGATVVTFTPSLSSSDTGSASDLSPGVLPPHGAQLSVEASGSVASQQMLYSETRCLQDLQDLRDELLPMVNARPTAYATAWNDLLGRVISLGALRSFFTGLADPPRSIESAEGIWQYHLRLLGNDLIVADTASEMILVYLVSRTTTILRHTWDHAVAPFLAHRSRSVTHRLSLAIPSPDLRVGGFTSSETTGPSLTTAATSRSVSPSSLGTDLSTLEGVSTPTPPLYSHANTGIASLDLPLSSDSGHPDATTQGRAHRVSARDLSGPVRVSLDSVESGVAVLDQELQHLEQAIPTDEVAVKIGYATRLRQQLVDVLSFVRHGSRSVSPSPTATHRRGFPRGRRSALPPTGTSTPPITAPELRSPLPWEVSRGTPAPIGATRIISPSDSSGRYHEEDIVEVEAAPSPATQDNSSRRPPFIGRTPTPSVVLPASATSADADIVEMFRLAGAEGDISDPNCWASLYERVLGGCLFSPIDQPDPYAPSTSTSMAHLRLSIGCVNSRHQELGLPCTLPIVIPFSLDLSALLHQLQVSQGTRVSQLMSIVAQAFLRHHQGGASTETLVPAASSSANAEASTSGSALTEPDADGGPEGTSTPPGPQDNARREGA